MKWYAFLLKKYNLVSFLFVNKKWQKQPQIYQNDLRFVKHYLRIKDVINSSKVLFSFANCECECFIFILVCVCVFVQTSKYIYMQIYVYNYMYIHVCVCHVSIFYFLYLATKCSSYWRWTKTAVSRKWWWTRGITWRTAWSFATLWNECCIVQTISRKTCWWSWCILLSIS